MAIRKLESAGITDLANIEALKNGWDKFTNVLDYLSSRFTSDHHISNELKPYMVDSAASEEVDNGIDVMQGKRQNAFDYNKFYKRATKVEEAE